MMRENVDDIHRAHFWYVMLASCSVATVFSRLRRYLVRLNWNFAGSVISFFKSKLLKEVQNNMTHKNTLCFPRIFYGRYLFQDSVFSINFSWKAAACNFKIRNFNEIYFSLTYLCIHYYLSSSYTINAVVDARLRWKQC